MADGVLEKELGQEKDVGGKYLTFKLGGEEYGIEILRVKTIIRVVKITPVPNVPSYVRGVIDLRGSVIPVVDLRAKFGFECVEDTKATCIVVVEVKQGHTTAMVGVLVDSVSEVLNIVADDVEPPPAFGDDQSRKGLRGMAKMNDGVKILLDIDQVVGNEVEEAVLESV